jgi:hypothetical protein
VTLRVPPPVDRAMRIGRDGDGATLLDEDQVVAEAREAMIEGEPPAAVSFEQATQLTEAFDVDAYIAWHHFPECFTCGPLRKPGDGLRIFPAAAGKHVIAWPWVPDEPVDDPLMWAALDCPSGLPWYHDVPPVSPHVLGRMTAVVHRRPTPGEQLVAAGWSIASDGRKRYAGSVIWGPDGEVLAQSRATWIVLKEAQRAAFNTA